MAKKLVVKFENIPVYGQSYEYITYCGHCQRYRIKDGRPCSHCEEEKDISIWQLAEKTVKRHLGTRIALSIVVYMLMIILSKNFKTMGVVTGITVVTIILQIIIYKMYKPHFCMNEVKAHLESNMDRIKEDLKKCYEGAKKAVDVGEYLAGYEKLRYLGKIMDSQELRLMKLTCLKEFSLRRDMPLEMKEILLDRCNIYLISYIYEVSKVKKEIIDEETLKYILTYEKDILQLHSGREVMASILSAALKSKYMLNKYGAAVYRYMDYMDKEKIIRLCKIKEGIKDVGLRRAIVERVVLKYGSDEAIEKYV